MNKQIASTVLVVTVLSGPALTEEEIVYLAD
jgi:hypothetical protein